MDREKVISTLEEIKTQTAEIGLDRAVIAHKFIDEILALLKEQEDLGTELTNAVELIHKKNVQIEKLLKKQEPKQIVRMQVKRENSDGSIDYFGEWYCPHCGKLLNRGFDLPWIEFCYKCGQAVKWTEPTAGANKIPLKW